MSEKTGALVAHENEFEGQTGECMLYARTCTHKTANTYFKPLYIGICTLTTHEEHYSAVRTVHSISNGRTEKERKNIGRNI